MNIDRKEAEAHLAKGWPVLAGGRMVQPGEKLPEKGKDFQAARTSGGQLSRAAMVHTILTGGSVTFQGRQISRVEDLPPEETVNAGNLPALKSTLAACEQEIAAQTARRSSILREIEETERKQAEAPKEEEKGEKKGHAHHGKHKE
jgi:hypothetical protein